MDTIDNNNDEATNDDIFEKLLCKDENLDGGDKVNDDLQHYFSNSGRPVIHSQGNHVRKPRGLSFDDLAATPESDAQSVRSGSMKGRREKVSEEAANVEPEKPEFHSNVFWRKPDIVGENLDDLLADYM